MNRIFNGRAFYLLVSLVTLAACSSSSDAPVDPEQPVGSLLKQVESAQQLEAALKESFTTINAVPAGDALAAGAAGPAPEGNFTGTYTQEKNVDEFDAVRYDGGHLYVAPRRYFPCCFLAVDGAVNSGQPPQPSIRILATDPASGTATLASEIPLEQDISVQGMYVTAERMFALTAQAMYGGYGDFWTMPAIWAPEKLGYRVYDLADKANPVLETDVSIDGVFVDSRRVGNVVYIISRYAPNLPGLIYYPTTAADVAQNQALLNGVTLDDMLPTITIDGITQTLVDPASCYVTNDTRMPKYPVITNITAVPIDDPKSFVNTCYNDEIYGAYVSESAIYFPQALSYLWPDDVKTRIHKFALQGTGVTYRGSGDIDGYVWRGGQADFRMSEQGSHLRLMSSKYNPSNEDFVDHLLYVLRESATEPALEIVGQLPNAARPEPIGKPNEDLYGVRFLGNRAYAVTFMRIDPLYVIDLANPADPFIAGELEITGFSDFLHPVSNDLLLGLGSAQAGGIKLELFDVSDISLPSSRGAVTLGGIGSWSEARWDRHAFTYQADVDGIDRFTIPASVYDEVDGIGSWEHSLRLYEIRDKATPDLASLVPVGSIVPPQTEATWPERSRAFIHDDTVYYVQDETVWSAFWITPTLVNGPF